MYIQRTLESKVEYLSDHFPVVIVCGARQVGKTTLLNQFKEKHHLQYVTLDYYRDNNGVEIDLILLENGKLYPIEIKKSADPGKSALKNFSVLDKLPEEISEGAVICMTPLVIPLDTKNKLVPVRCI